MNPFPRFTCEKCGWAGNDPHWVFRPTRLYLDGRLDGSGVPLCPECNEEVMDRFEIDAFG